MKGAKAKLAAERAGPKPRTRNDLIARNPILAAHKMDSLLAAYFPL